MKIVVLCLLMQIHGLTHHCGGPTASSGSNYVNNSSSSDEQDGYCCCGNLKEKNMMS